MRNFLDEQLDLTRDLIEQFPIENTMCFYLKQDKEQSREYLAHVSSTSRTQLHD